MGEGKLNPQNSGGHDTLDTRIVPIIMVPGVMGTRLSITGSAVNWDPDDAAQMGDWLASGTDKVRTRIDFRTGTGIVQTFPLVNIEPPLTPDVEPANDILARERLVDIATKGQFHFPATKNRLVREFWEARGWGQLVWSFYGQILMQMAEELNPGKGASEGHPVYACGYDWRQSNAESGNLLRTTIDQVIANHPLAKDVVIVTHSMGGLVARAMLLQSDANVGGVVHTVQPADGAIVAYRRFFTGAHANLGDGPAPLCNILGDSPEEYFETQSGARGPMELLPHNSYPDAVIIDRSGKTNKDEPDIYAMYERDRPPGLMQAKNKHAAELRARLGEARDFTGLIAGVFHPRTSILLGNETLTDMGYDFRKSVPAPAPGVTPPSPPPPAPGSTPAPAAAPAALPQNPITEALGRTFIERRVEGDGTVPAPSAEFRAVPNPLARSRFGVTHAECFQNPDFRAATIRQIRRILAEL
jgi:pimeloyl-ACP methyl ester carboxylesterase